MKKLRPAALAKFLQTIHQPFFLLDETSTMLFCNHALEEWTGCEAEQLIGQRLRYRTTASRLKHEIVAAALAPPPEVFQGNRYRSVLTIDRIAEQSRRVADFIPLSPSGVLVLIDEHESETRDAMPSGSVERQAAAELHQALASFRRRQVGRFRWDRLIGSSQQMQRIRRLGRLAVDSMATVLIDGQRGTGKEHLASAIHYAAQGEAAGALVPVECSVLGSELIASTIAAFRKKFQQEKGPRRHTLLLKDADALPESFTAVMTDFISAAPANLRVVATSTRPAGCWEGRETLEILLGTIRIELPPLRERKDDLPLLAQMFLEDRNLEAGRQRAGFTSEALDLMLRYDWSGNLDELEALVDEVHDRGHASLVAAIDLPDRLRNVFDAATQADPDDIPIDLDVFLGQIERELIERALRLARGNKSLAAERLGLTRPRLYRRLESLGMLEDEPED